MSKLIFTGDTTNNFGRLLPAPYVDKIYINEEEIDGATYATINPKIEIYIKADVNEDVTTLISQLGELKIWWLCAMSSLTDLDNVINREQNIWAFMLELWAGTIIGRLSDVIEFSDLDEHQVVYDDEGNRLLKFTYLSDEPLTLPNEAAPDEILSAWSDNVSDVYLFAFASFDIPGDGAYWSEYSFTGDDNFDDRFGRFMTIETGDIAYEPVWIDDEPAWEEQVIWVDEDDNTYDDTPLQSLASKYYSIDKVTHAEIVSSFEDLLGTYEAKAEIDDDLQSIMDQISYVLEVYGAAANLLSQLNMLGRAFPDKSSSTNTGLLYLDFKEKVSATNAVIKTGTEIFRKEVINSKVIDERTATTAVWSTADEDRTTDTDFDGDFVTNMKLGRSSILYVDSREDTAVWNNYGYVFFDYEKALYETADIGYYFKMDTLYNILGSSYLNGYFQLSHAKYERAYSGDFDGYPFIKMQSEFDDGYKISQTTWTDTGTEKEWTADHSEPYIYSSADCVAHSFVLLRNFELAREEGWDGYRMMCFEFQDFEDEDNVLSVGPGFTPYFGLSDIKFTATVDDTTKELVSDMIDAYAALGEEDGGMYEYMNAAQDPINYSEDEGRWTDSFQALMHDIYDDNMAAAPWVLYPAYYCVFLDLATHEFEGDLDKIKEEVNRIVGRINPYNGSLTELESFGWDFASLYTDVLTGIQEDLDADDDGSPVLAVTADWKNYYNTFGYTGDGGKLDTSTYEWAEGTTVCEAAAYAASVEGVDLSDMEEISPSSTVPTDGDEDVKLLGPDGDKVFVKIKYDNYGSEGDGISYFDGTKIDTDFTTIDTSYFDVTLTGYTSTSAEVGRAKFKQDTDELQLQVHIDGLKNDKEYTLTSDFGGIWLDSTGAAFADFSITFTTEEEEVEGEET